MNIRRVLLRIMLGSLAVAAGLGALAVLFIRNDAVWRIVVMGLVTAVTSGLLLPVSLLTDKPKSRRAGLLAVVAVLVEYVLCLLLIWDVPEALNVSTEPFAFTALLLPCVALPAVALLRMTTVPATRVAGGVGVVLAAIEFILLMVAVWGERILSGKDEWYATSGVGAIFLPMVIACLVGAGTNDRRWWRWIGVGAVVAALTASLFGVWRETGDHAGPYTVLVTVGALLAYANLAMQCSLKPGQGWVRWATLLAVLITAACVDSAIIMNQDTDRFEATDALHRIGAASAIIGGCGTLALLLLAALNRRIEAPVVAIAEVHALTIVCPLCQKKQTMKTGGAQCAGCGLRIAITLEEPRCATCGYLLYGLKSDRCPECGTATGAVTVAT